MTTRATIVFGPDRKNVARCRRWLREQLAGVPAELCEQVVLLASEVTTNAFLHARTNATVSLSVGPQAVRVEVRDDSELPPLRRHLGRDASMGRGLVILDALASSWGVDLPSDGVGKVVWFEIGRDAVSVERDAPAGRDRDAATVSPSPGSERGPSRTVVLMGTPIEVADHAWAEYARIIGELRLVDQQSERSRQLFELLEAAEACAPNLRLFSLIAEELVTARGEGSTSVDLEISTSERAGDAARYLDAFLDGLASLHRSHGIPLLSPPPTAQSRALSKWLLGEFIRQSEGKHPTAWRDFEVSE